MTFVRQIMYVFFEQMSGTWIPMIFLNFEGTDRRDRSFITRGEWSLHFRWRRGLPVQDVIGVMAYDRNCFYRAMEGFYHMSDIRNGTAMGEFLECWSIPVVFLVNRLKTRESILDFAAQVHNALIE